MALVPEKKLPLVPMGAHTHTGVGDSSVVTGESDFCWDHGGLWKG